MISLNRFSSRHQQLDQTFLKKRLRDAKSYKRIAGYFRSSIFELVGEEIVNIPNVQIVCNSDLEITDIAVSKSAREIALKEHWNEMPAEVETLLYRERYRQLYQLLSSGRVEIRVVPKDLIFLHGKAGVIELENGQKTCFLGSVNETKSAFSNNYEILWEDTSPEGVAWVEEEFDALWKQSFPLPDAIIEEVKRVSQRIEISFREADEKELPGAIFAESPIYRGGEQLQPWQRSFVTLFMQHRKAYGQARLLLADEVGVGKTLSLATSATLAAILEDGPVLILCPSSLTLQWQVELYDKLGVPSAVWSSNKKVWLDPDGHSIRTRGPEDIALCPLQIAIASTGLIFHRTEEREYLLSRKYGTIILDEAHRARRSGGYGNKSEEPNNLLSFMRDIAKSTKNLLLATATPIQTNVFELWDLMDILNSGVNFVLGREPFSVWSKWERSLPIVKGEQYPQDEKEAWDWIRNPIPAGDNNPLFSNLRLLLSIREKSFFLDKGYSSLNFSQRQLISQTLETNFFKENNPITRHTVLRRRSTLEDAGLMERVGVNIFPDGSAPVGTYKGIDFIGIGLMTNHPFNQAYQAAVDFTSSLRKRSKAAGFMKALLLQRICSSFASGKLTAERMLAKQQLDDEEQASLIKSTISELTEDEKHFLQEIINELSRPEARDPKLNAVKFFITNFRTEGKTWLEHGSIIFSQYYDTAFYIATELAKLLPEEVIGIYAGADRSGLLSGVDFSSVKREEIKKAVKNHNIRLLVATDAACEGLNLQSLGTLINIDLPWNPARLEQRLGRIKRFGQIRKEVDMLNLVYHDTQDEKVYQTLSKRMKDRYDIFGGLPDVIDDEWIENIEELEEKMDQYIHLRKSVKDVFELHYQKTIDPSKDRWELCSKVLSRRDIVDRLSKPW